MVDKPIPCFATAGSDVPALEAWAPIPDVISGDPVQSGYVSYTDPSGHFIAGMWQCSPGKFAAGPLAEDEFAYLLSGKLIITDEAGRARTVLPGDGFTSPKGWVGTWEVVETIRKVFAVYTDSPQEWLKAMRG